MAVAVQVDGGPKYERTKDIKRMLTHPLLDKTIREDWENIKQFLPARTATSIRYERGAKTAKAWNEGGSETKIDLPLEDGWYVPDGNPFAIPNGKPSNRSDPAALYLVRHQDREFSGSLARDFVFFGFVDGDGRFVGASGYWSGASGVALIGGRGATAPLVEVPKEGLAKITDPKALVQRAEQLETAAKELKERLGATLHSGTYARLIKPILDEASFLRELVGKIEALQQKA